ncbi:MAG: nitrilase-related carbon-nitrogen hydrolase [Promethearchaeota archaeon]
MKTTQVSLIQMDIEFGKKTKNLNKAEKLISNAASQAPQNLPHIICLPELFSTGYDLDNVQKHAEIIPGGETTTFLQKMAKQHTAIVIASWIEKEEDLFYNTAAIMDESGVFLGKYRKIHLFPPMREPEIFSIGGFLHSDLSYPTNCGILGFLICYDLRFPELSRRITLEGKVDFIFYLAEFPHPKYKIWTKLLQARAIENQLFVCGVNRVGNDLNFEYFGHSVIYDPGGDILVEGTEEEEVVTARLDPAVLFQVRSILPSLQHRQPDYY